MYAFLSKLLLTRKISFEEGKITLFNEPYAIVAMDSLKEMTDDAMQRGLKAISDLYFYGWVFGFIGVRKAVDMFKLKKFEERYKLSMDIASLIGFGDYKTIEYKHEQYAKFLAIANPFAKLYYKSDILVDHYLRGVNAGGGTVGHETLMQCVELECAAKNNEKCLFVNTSRDFLKSLDPKIVATQLDIQYLEEKQKNCILRAGDDPKKYGL